MGQSESGQSKRKPKKPLAWLRYYIATLESKKVQDLAPPAFKAWINCLCVARSNNGCLPPMPDIAFRLRCSEKQALGWISELIKARLIDETESGLQMHDWNEHQYVSDDVTERVRSYRMKRFMQRSTENVGNVSPSVSESVSVSDSEKPENDEVKFRELLERENGFDEWRKLCESVGVSNASGAGPEDWKIASGIWKVMDFEQRSNAMKGMSCRRGMHDDPVVKSLPQNILKYRKYERKVTSLRPVPSPQTSFDSGPPEYQPEEWRKPCRICKKAPCACEEQASA